MSDLTKTKGQLILELARLRRQLSPGSTAENGFTGAEEALKKSEARYKLLVANLPNVVFTGYKDWSVDLIDNKIEQLTGYHKDEFNSRRMKWIDIVAAEDYDHIKKIFIQALRTTKTYVREYRIKHKAGHALWIQEGSQITCNEVGEIDFVSGAFLDITERKLAEEAVKESERRFADIIDFLPDATLVIDRQGKVLAWNRAIEAMTGVKAADMLGKDNYEYALPFYGERRPILIDHIFQKKEKFEKKYARVSRRGETLLGETYVPHLKGGGVYLTAAAGGLYDAEGKVVGAIEVIRDITERKHTDEALRRQKEYLAALHETTLGLINHLELQDLLQALVTRAGQLFGTPHGFIYLVKPEGSRLECRVGLGIFSRVIGSHLEAGQGLSGKVWQTGQPLAVANYQSWSNHAPGLDLDYETVGAVMAVPLKSGSRLVGVLGLAHHQETDQTFGDEEVGLLSRFAELASLALDNARLYSEAQEAREAAETANQSKSTFLANMSHELRTPLNAIIGYSEMLMEDAADLGQEDFVSDLEKIHGAGQHLLGLINDILDLSKIEANKMDLYLESFEVSRLVQEVVSTIRPLVEKNGNILKVRLADGVEVMYADQTKVRQSLFNLLSNACKFTEQGTISLEVQRETVTGVDWLKFTVRDSGIGMTPEQLQKLFQVFVQADVSTSRKYGGTGLGMAITKRFCEMMGGEIAVASDYGSGTAFTIRLPAQVKGRRAAAPTATAQPAAKMAAEPAPEGAKTVLVIEDDANARELMTRFLQKEGFRVLTATGGEEGLRLLREQRPDIITLDVLMPGMDGWAVLTAIKSDPSLADIPVIMLSIVDDKNMGYALGATDYLTKPIDRDRLVATLAKYKSQVPLLQILVVEDDPGSRELFKHSLDKEGWEVREAENGRLALEVLAQRLPAAILLDLMMPEMDGFQFLEKLRQNPEWRAIPVVVVTSKDLTGEDRLRLNGYVEKVIRKGSYRPEELLAEVRGLIRNCLKA